MCSICEPLDDNIDDLLPASAAFAEKVMARIQPAKPTVGSVMYYEPCKDCGGSGNFISYAGRLVGPCFKCKGAGQIGFKTSPEQRQKVAETKQAKLAAKIAAWVSAHTEEFEWMTARAARGNNFAMNMLDSLSKYGDLTEGKLNGVRKGIVHDQLAAEERAAILARAPDIDSAPLAKLELAFATALENQIKYPKLRLDTFIFSPVQSGKNKGSIYVKHTTETGRDGEKRYLGKITDGRFIRVHGCTPEEEQRIVAAAMDPAAAAKAYGQREGVCSICARKLTKGESIDRGIWQNCSEKYGW